MTRKIKFSKLSFAFILAFILAAGVVIYSGCSKDDNKPAATCSDGIQNQGETGVDCGGPCTACATCSDGIQNQGETGVDCGGPCSPCATASLTATIDGAPFTATFIQAQLLSGMLVIQATNGSKTLSLVHSGALATGTYTLQSVSTNYATSSITCLCTTSSITFTTFNTTTQKVSGTFYFNCTDASSTAHSITSGSFANIGY